MGQKAPRSSNAEGPNSELLAARAPQPTIGSEHGATRASTEAARIDTTGLAGGEDAPQVAEKFIAERLPPLEVRRLNSAGSTALSSATRMRWLRKLLLDDRTPSDNNAPEHGHHELCLLRTLLDMEQVVRAITVGNTAHTAPAPGASPNTSFAKANGPLQPRRTPNIDPCGLLRLCSAISSRCDVLHAALRCPVHVNLPTRPNQAHL